MRSLLLLPLATCARAQNLLEQPVLCPNAQGAIVGLASDGTYHVRPPSNGGTVGTNPESWMVVHESVKQGPFNSFTGTFVQVLPDDHDSYNDIYGAGSFTMTGLDWAFDVTTAGMHTLFLRWTGGDTVGGGDSLYATVRKDATDELVRGPDTYKPKMLPIDETPGMFTGCCYSPMTHACPCFTPDMNSTAMCQSPNGYWVPLESSRQTGRTCKLINGEMAFVDSPRWYLFSGQDAGNIMDFASEPWDATCEAEGTSTADSGKDFAQWELTPGRYHIVFYPREDGTAIDAFYLTPPGVAPPTGDTVLVAGSSSTECSATGGGASTPVARPGADLIHRDGDVAGWGHHDYDGQVDAQIAGGECGRCLIPVNSSECPEPSVLQTMATCDDVELGELCEADGECGTQVRLNNCDNPLPDPGSDAGRGKGDGKGDGHDHGGGHDHRGGGHDHGGGGDWGSWRRANRNNDVYKRIPCDEWALALRGPSRDGGGSGATAPVLVTLVLLSGVLATSYTYVRYSQKTNGGLVVMPWKLARRAQTSTIDSGGAGPLASSLAPGLTTAYQSSM